MTGTITMRLFGLITALAITVSLLNPASAAELQLLPRIVVDGDVITLGHLFGDMGEAGEIVVARSPEPGKRITITVASTTGRCAIRGSPGCRSAVSRESPSIARDAGSPISKSRRRSAMRLPATLEAMA